MGENENLEEIIGEGDLNEIGDGDYSPDYTYKFKDEVRNFDERFNENIKSKEDEDAYRDLYTRADGLDSYKSKYSDLETKYSDLEGQAKQLTGGFEVLQNLTNGEGKDMRGLMQALGVSNDDILDYSETLLNEEELPEEQKKLVLQNREMTQRMSDMESRMSNMTNEAGSAEYTREQDELNSLIGTEDVQPLAAKMEEFGVSLYDEVVTHGRNIFENTNKMPSIPSVLKLVSDKYSRMLNIGGTTNNIAETEDRKPTLPSVKANANRSAGGKVKSLDDLRALAESQFS